MLWESLAQKPHDQQRPLLGLLEASDEPAVPLPSLAPRQQVLADYRTTGLSLQAHPLSFVRKELHALQVVRASDLAHLRNGQFVRVAGLVILRQRPGTANGITFMTLEDETGVSNLIVRMDIWQRYYQAARTATALLASGRLQHHDGVIHLLVTKLEDLTTSCSGLRQSSRDFR